ncbi:MAG: zinc metallopeptidase [Gammaproteobacteria bacterium]|nr:zinc metallopeptidase [Gammaproteobacteria bacterium]MBL6999961.1 zinc metallopeptidase [Gammaproteobacteria bacterium]
MPYLLLFVVLLLLIYLPQYWVRHVLNRYNQHDEENFSGTGGELARHLLDRFELQHVKVEVTESGDHYDPVSQSVRLTKDKHDGKTLTAITVAAHECGHAFQHAARQPLFLFRSQLAGVTIWAARVGSFLLFSAPFLALLTRAPSVALLNISGAFLIMGFALLLQIITLPVELDASFNKALPLLQSGYLDQSQMPAARQILSAAAWTYVAVSLASLLNFWRWFAILRR